MANQSRPSYVARDISAAARQQRDKSATNPRQFRDKSATDLRRQSPVAATPADNGRLPCLPTA
eukprot:5158357-Amphidinium_carterae.1